MRDYTYIGNQTIVNVDGPDKVAGRAKYVGDMRAPGMLIAKVLRSELPHARIVKLDVTPALRVPGVLAAITHADFVEHGNFGWPVKDQYVLAYEKVRYVGDPIAAVAAETEAAARAGLAAIVLELEPLLVVSDVAQANAPDAPLIPQVSPTGQGNLCETHIVRNGDPAPLLAAAPVLLDATYAFAHQEHAYLETEGALALPEPDGGLTLYANNQSPFINRGTVAEVLGLPETRVRSIQPPVGGAFGGKDDCVYQTAAQAGKLALLTGRPVRLTLERTESIKASYKRQAARIHERIGVEQDGNLLAAHAVLLVDSGAYASMTPMTSWRATMHAAGPYRYQAAHVDTQVFYTNNGYSGAFRGFGNIQASAAADMALDELAQRLDRDPLEFRLQNCLRQGDRTLTGDLVEYEIGFAACLEWVRDRADWRRKRSEYAAQPADASVRRGIGVGGYFHGCGLGSEGLDYAASTIAIEADYSITLTSGLTDYGQGSRTVFTILAAETLGVSLERIRVLRPDTNTALDSGPTVASRASIVGGNAVRVAAEKLRLILNLAAADLLGCQPEQLLRVGEQYIGPTEEPVTFAAVVDHARAMGFQTSAIGRWEGPPIHWDFERGVGKPYFAYSFGAQAAEVEVNVQTGKVKVLKVWAAHDAGTIIYPKGALGQMYGGIVQGIGYALMEGMRYENGIPQTTNLSTYRIPRALDVPDIEGTFIPTTLPLGPYGAKNLAEPVMIGVVPAIANAVFHATGVRVREIPIRPELLKR